MASAASAASAASTIRIMALGDVVGEAGLDHLSRTLWSARDKYKPDLVIVNGENATNVQGLSSTDAKAILDAGADLITLGNHAFRMRDLHEFLDSGAPIIRPANFPAGVPGMGSTILNAAGWRVLCVNLQGVVGLDALADPFTTLDKILETEKGRYDLAVLDFHAEATSEKCALGRAFDGRIGAIFGTHTHIPTADEQILPGGTGYITDVGMTGPVNSILGTKIDAVLEKFRTHLPVRMVAADGPALAQGVLFDILPDSGGAPGGKCTSVRRIQF